MNPDSQSDCTFCKTSIGPRDRFCAHCGGLLPARPGLEPTRVLAAEPDDSGVEMPTAYSELRQEARTDTIGEDLQPSGWRGASQSPIAGFLQGTGTPQSLSAGSGFQVITHVVRFAEPLDISPVNRLATALQFSAPSDAQSVAGALTESRLLQIIDRLADPTLIPFLTDTTPDNEPRAVAWVIPREALGVIDQCDPEGVEVRDDNRSSVRGAAGILYIPRDAQPRSLRDTLPPCGGAVLVVPHGNAALKASRAVRLASLCMWLGPVTGRGRGAIGLCRDGVVRVATPVDGTSAKPRAQQASAARLRGRRPILGLGVKVGAWSLLIGGMASILAVAMVLLPIPPVVATVLLAVWAASFQRSTRAQLLRFWRNTRRAGAFYLALVGLAALIGIVASSHLVPKPADEWVLGIAGFLLAFTLIRAFSVGLASTLLVLILGAFYGLILLSRFLLQAWFWVAVLLGWAVLAICHVCSTPIRREPPASDVRAGFDLVVHRLKDLGGHWGELSRVRVRFRSARGSHHHHA